MFFFNKNMIITCYFGDINTDPFQVKLSVVFIKPKHPIFFTSFRDRPTTFYKIIFALSYAELS